MGRESNALCNKHKRAYNRHTAVIRKIMWDVSQNERNIKTIAFREFNAL